MSAHSEWHASLPSSPLFFGKWAIKSGFLETSSSFNSTRGRIDRILKHFKGCQIHHHCYSEPCPSQKRERRSLPS
ncbi:hypothetical protein M431DRAFT_501151 [Trichoderma harzianum CBS 226.95]|uniref:Uncharacterized protein n=1 Tax=Trichoderma harzianum CBS 226.95 TaxID=983964 RepID=A0A2T3ZUE8_TRIHA|nr:hypothetical protein M431DRAFT_501151 [Trichoderma harzianum CBS 226.95]PTB48444.1 hypothetical protein M431DRAFT_501151 [Trichoderma harzianum CBS 226.95]